MSPKGLLLLPSSVLTRSSHLPLAASILFPTRCDGVHRLAATRAAADPLELPVEMEPARDRLWLPVRARGLFPLREDVRSRRRVWYANAPVALEEIELERSRPLPLKEPPVVLEAADDADLEEEFEFIELDLSISCARALMALVGRAVQNEDGEEMARKSERLGVKYD